MNASLPSTIPIFPLPQVVFFPGTYLPLHIFEPRYREMVRTSWLGDRMIGMVLLREGWERDYYDRPPVFPVGCAGRIISLQPLADGRFNLVLEGIRKFEIEEEQGARPFRQASVVWRENRRGGFESSMRDEILRRVRELLCWSPEAGKAENLLSLDLEDTSMIHTISYALPFTPLEKQFLLESADLGQQGKRLMDLLTFAIASLKGKGEGTG
ncbi:MAG: LON peptidase substrate-binding domain-containing protein [Nitrospirae bacterium]|nr:LON peptidase substrate-binding domain-containing protein [Nitrospirota bacterium]